MLWPGVIVEADLALTDAHDLHVGKELLEGAAGWATGTTGALSLTQELKEKRLDLLAPYKSNKKEKGP